MAHVIDSLVVELGLDASKFNQQQKQAVAASKQSVNDLRKQGAEVEDSSAAAGESIISLTKRATGMFLALAGARGFVELGAGAIKAGAEVGRLSRAIGVSANEISKWQGVAVEFGSTGEAMANSFKEISNVFTAWKVGGPEAPGIMQIFRLINTEAERLDHNNAKVIDSAKGVGQSYLDLADNLKIIHDQANDPNLASYLAGKIPGMDAGMFDALIRGGGELAETMKKIHGWTDAEAEAAGRLQRRWDALKVSASNWSLHTLFKGIDWAKNAWEFQITGGGKQAPYSGWGNNNFTQSSVNSQQVGQGRSPGAFQSKADKVAFIRAEATRQGQNPDVWVKLGNSEGVNSYNGDPDASGKPTSFGSFQLHYPGMGRNTADGLGTQFTKETGLDARDPKTEAEQIAWVMRYAKTHDLTPWHGWKGDPWAHHKGVQAAQGGATSNDNSSSSSTTITGPITIYSGARAEEVGSKLRDLGIRRIAEANQASVGGE